MDCRLSRRDPLQLADDSIRLDRLRQNSALVPGFAFKVFPEFPAEVVVVKQEEIEAVDALRKQSS